MKSVIAILLLFGVAFTAYAEAQEWYKLDDDEVYITDFLLQAGQNKKVKVDSSQPVTIGFRTDVTSYEKYKELSEKYGTNIIKFTDVNNELSLSTVSGGFLRCEPANNEVLIDISNLIDMDFKVVIYKKNIYEETEEKLAPSSPAEIAKFFAEGEAEFKKEGYIEQNGAKIKQPDAFCSVSLQGNTLKAIFEIFMMNRCFNEKTFRNTPGVVIGFSVISQDTSEKMYFGYNVAFLDENKNLIGRAVNAGDVGPNTDTVSNYHINLTSQEIAKIKYYKIILYESKGKITEQILAAN